MKKTVLLCLLCGYTAGIFARKPDLKYTIHWDADTALTLVLACKGAASGASKIYFPDKTWGLEQLWQVITRYTCHTPGSQVTPVRDSGYFLIRHAPGAMLRFEYRLKQDYTGPLKDYYRPAITGDYFHVFSQSLLALPEHVFPDNQQRLQVQLDWENFPANWTLHNSFGHQQRRQHLYVRQSELSEAIFMGGADFRYFNFQIQKNTAWLAIQGQWPAAPDSALQALLERVLRTQRDFWNDHSQPYYSVSLIPTYGEWTEQRRDCGITGTGLTNSFAAGGTNNPCIDMQILRYLFNHELMHNWIGKSIVNAHEELQYWFSEGFTDYFTYKNMLVSGMMDAAAFCDAFNQEVLAAHYGNSRRNAPNYLIRDSFWLSRDFEKLPYRRGAVFAFWLDNQIKMRSRYKFSLNDLMRDLLAHARAEKEPLSDEFFLKTAQFYLNEDISAFFQRHLIVGEPIDFEKSNWPEYLIVKTDAKGIPRILIDEGVADWPTKLLR